MKNRRDHKAKNLFPNALRTGLVGIGLSCLLVLVETIIYWDRLKEAYLLLPDTIFVYILLGFILGTLYGGGLSLLGKNYSPKDIIAIGLASIFSFAVFIVFAIEILTNYFSPQKTFLWGGSLLISSLIIFFVIKKIMSHVVAKSFIKHFCELGTAKLFLISLFFLIIPCLVSFSYKRLLVNKTVLSPNANRPNILLIVMDTLRVDHLSCYGYHKKTSPHIDKLSKEGTLFKNVNSHAEWTLPSHASLFTGMHVSRHGVKNSQIKLDEDFSTLAEVLYKQGYQTLSASSNEYISTQFNLDQGFQLTPIPVFPPPYAAYKIIWRIISSAFVSGSNKTRRTVFITGYVRFWLDYYWNKDQPFFMFLNYMDPHLPWDPPPPFNTMFLNKNVAEEDFNRVLQKATIKTGDEFNAGKIKLNEQELEILTSLYDGEIAYLDFKLNQLVNLLKKKGIMDQTMLILTADHGENIGDHGLMSHTLCLYNSLIHVPLIIRYPKLFPAGKQIETRLSQIDIMPTIMNILGIEWDKEAIDGRSFINQGKIFNPEQFPVAESFNAQPLKRLKKLYPDFDPSRFSQELSAIYQNNIKFIQKSDGKDELYDIKTDPGELINLIDKIAYDLKPLQEKIATLKKSAKNLEDDDYIKKLRDDFKKDLRALGYLE